MPYYCNCIPTQKLPHIVKSPKIKTYFLGIPYWFKLPFYSYSIIEAYKTGKKRWHKVSGFQVAKTFYVLTLITYISPPVDCNGTSVPVRERRACGISFGKVIN